jgi:hypothetical protein
MRSFALAVLTLVASAPVLAERGPPEVGSYTGRPGVSEPSVTVPRGLLLVNGGMTFAGAGGEGLLDPNQTTVWTAPDLLVRAGVMDVLELRAGGTLGAVRNTGPFDFNIPYVAPMNATVGMAVAALPETEWIPAVAVIGSLGLPTLTLDALDMAGELRVSVTKGIGSFGVTTNLASGWDNSRGQAFANYTLAGTWSLPAGIGLFVEAYGGMDIAPTPTVPSLGIDGGMGVQVSPALMVDVSAGAVFLGEPAMFLSVGGSWRPS